MSRVLFCLLMCFCSASYLSAQEDKSLEELLEEKVDQTESEEANQHVLVSPDQLETTRAYQSKPVDMKNFDEKKWKEIVGEVDYREAVAEQEKEEEKGENDGSDVHSPNLPWAGPLLKLISYAVIIGVVILLVYFIISNISVDLHIKRTEFAENPEKPVENIETLDIDALLDKASREKNYKTAVRLYYLRLLKGLNERGIISWKKDKTNREYLAELFSRNYHFEEIRRLTMTYESVWYGDHALKADTFEGMVSRFESIHQQINSADKQ